MENLKAIQEAAAQVVAIKTDSKAGRESLKSLGSQVSDMTRAAFRDQDQEVIDWINSQRGNRTEKTKPSKIMESNKQYFARGEAVGVAEREGQFSKEELNLSTVTLYDKLLAKRKKAEEILLAKKEKEMRNRKALELVLKDQSVDEFETVADPMTYATTLMNGLAMLAEADKEAEQVAREQDAANSVTQIKAALDGLKDEFPALYAEIVAHIKPAKANAKAA